MEAEPEPETDPVEVRHTVHYQTLEGFLDKFVNSSDVQEKTDLIRRLRYYCLTSTRVRACITDQHLSERLIDEILNINISDARNVNLIRECVQTLASFALVPSPSADNPPIAKWEQVCQHILRAFETHVYELGMAVCQFFANLIVRLTSGANNLQQSRDSCALGETGEGDDAWFSQASQFDHSSSPMFNTRRLRLIFYLLDYQDGPSLETVAHLFFRLFTVAADDVSTEDNFGFNRCTPILFVKRTSFRELFSGEEERLTLIKRLSSFLQSTTNINVLTTALHILCLTRDACGIHELMASLAPVAEIHDLLYSPLAQPINVDLNRYHEDVKEKETSQEFVSRLRDIGKRVFLNTQAEPTPFNLIDHIFTLTKSVQKPIVQFMSCLIIAILLQRGKWLSPAYEHRSTRLFIPSVCRLACLLHENGDSEDTHNIPLMAMLILIRVVPLYPRFEKVAFLHDNLPKRLIQCLKNPATLVGQNVPQELPEWSLPGGRRLYRTPIVYDVTLWSRFFLSFDPCDPVLFYPIVGIPLKHPWVTEQTFRCVVLQCIASLCARLDRSRKRFLEDEDVYTLVLDACGSQDAQVKLSGLICFHILSRCVAPLAKQIACGATCQKMFAVFTEVLMQATADDEDLRSIYDTHPSSNPLPLDSSGSSGGCPADRGPVFEYLSCSSDDSERGRLLMVMPGDLELSSLTIRTTLAILGNLSVAMGPLRPPLEHPELAGYRALPPDARMRIEWEMYIVQRAVMLNEASIVLVIRLLSHPEKAVFMTAMWTLINMTHVASTVSSLILQHMDMDIMEAFMRSTDIYVLSRAFILVENLILLKDQSPELLPKQQDLFERARKILVERQGSTDEHYTSLLQLMTGVLFGSLCSSIFYSAVNDSMVEHFTNLIGGDDNNTRRCVIRAFTLMYREEDRDNWLNIMRYQTSAYDTVNINKDDAYSPEFRTEAQTFMDLLLGAANAQTGPPT